MNIPGIKTPLLPHQLKALDKLIRSPQGMILAHGVGSGKTLSSIAAGNLLRKPVDVIVPAPLVNNYNKQLSLHTTNRSVPFNVLSAGAVSLHPELLENPENKILVVDEAHKIRNEKSKLYNIIKDAPYSKKILLTGTPVYNAPVDIASLVSLIDPEPDPHRRLVPSRIRRFFGETLEDTIQKEIESRLRFNAAGSLMSPARTEIKRELNGIPYKEDFLRRKYIDNSTPYIQRKFEGAADLRRMIRIAAGVLARKKDEAQVREKYLHEYEHHRQLFDEKINNFVDYYKVPESSDYPQKIYEEVHVPMRQDQERVYTGFFKKLPQQLQNKILTNKLEKLPPSQVQNPFLVYTRMISNNYQGTSPKIDKMIEDIKAEPGKTVVYSNFLENGLYPMSKRLDQEGISHRIFTGAESPKEKAQIVKDYNADKIKVLALSSSGGEGLDLKRTKQIQIMEPHWNDAKIEQVIGRGARYKSHEGLPEEERKVVIRNYLATIKDVPQTTETFMKHLSEHKKEVSQEVLSLLK